MREASNVNKADIARAAGIRAPSVSDWFSGKTKTIEGANLLAAARVLGVRPDWLATGRGPMRTVDGDDSISVHVPVSPPATPPGYVRLERLAIEVSAGGGSVVGDESDVVEMLEVADWWAQQNLPRDLSKVRVVTARGDSMAPDIQHGDVLFVDVSQPRFEAPGLYVMNWHGHALVKRLVPEMTRQRLAIVSTNPQYPVEHVDAGDIDSLRIAGRVAAWWTLRKY